MRAEARVRARQVRGAGARILSRTGDSRQLRGAGRPDHRGQGGRPGRWGGPCGGGAGSNPRAGLGSRILGIRPAGEDSCLVGVRSLHKISF